MAVHLVCEGGNTGLDNRVLDRLVIQFHNLAVQMAPSGGSAGLGAVRVYLLNRSPNDVAISVEDRDYYRTQAQAHASWGTLAATAYIWRRHEIENYLVHPRIVLELFNDFRAARVAWASALPATEADASALVQALAAPLLEDHAAQLLKDELVRQIDAIGSLSFGPPAPTPAAGAHTPAQAQWLAALQQEATRLCQTCTSVAAGQSLEPAEIAARYAALVAQFQPPAFLHSGTYLIDMKGKHLLAALSRELVGLGAPAGLSRNVLADELLRVLERIYQPNSIYQPDDFVELADILRQY